jgi:hypothetical protein
MLTKNPEFVVFAGPLFIIGVVRVVRAALVALVARVARVAPEAPVAPDGLDSCEAQLRRWRGVGRRRAVLDCAEHVTLGAALGAALGTALGAAAAIHILIHPIRARAVVPALLSRFSQILRDCEIDLFLEPDHKSIFGPAKTQFTLGSASVCIVLFSPPAMASCNDPATADSAADPTADAAAALCSIAAQATAGQQQEHLGDKRPANEDDDIPVAKRRGKRAELKPPTSPTPSVQSATPSTHIERLVRDLRLRIFSSASVRSYFAASKAFCSM